MYLFQGTERSSGQDAGYREGVLDGGAAMMGVPMQTGSPGGGQDSTACSLCVNEMTCLALVTCQTHL